MMAPPRTQRRLTIVMIVALLTQFILGMVVNLYVRIPAHHPGAHASDYFGGVLSGVRWAVLHGEGSLAVHAALGLVLAVAGLALAATVWRTRDRVQITLVAFGALFAIGAGFNGASFLDFGNAISSLLMSILFALSLASFGASLGRTTG